MLNTERALSVKVDTKLAIPIEHLHEFQGSLKRLDKDEFQALKRSTITNGMQSAMSVWQNPDTKKWCILDGHQRRLVYLALKEDGYFVPPVPVVQVMADNYEEAKKSVLIQAARYGKITQESLADYAIDSSVDLEFIQEYVRLSDVRVSDLGLEQVGTGNFVESILQESKPEFQNFIEDRFNGDPTAKFVKMAFGLDEYKEFEIMSNETMAELGIENVKDLFMHLLKEYEPTGEVESAEPEAEG